MQQSQKKIYNRMVKNAAKSWGHSDMDVENSFDPVISMLMGSLSSELSKLYAQSTKAKAEVIEKLLEIVTPEAEMGPFAASGIATAQPIEEKGTLKKKHQLFTSIRLEDKYDPINVIKKTIYFSPCGDFPLLNTEIKAFIYGSTVVTFDDDGDPIHHENKIKGNAPNVLRIGLSKPLLENLDGLTFYFDTLAKGDRDLFLHYLKEAKWSCFEKEINTRIGFHDDEKDEWYDLDKVLHNRLGNSDIQEKKIRDKFRKQFVTVNDVKPISAEPSEFYKTLDEDKSLREVPKELIWLEVSFNEIISQTFLQNVSFKVNAFPVINRQYKRSIFRIGEYFNYFKLLDENHFFDLAQVTLTDGALLTQPVYNNLSKLDENQVLIRHSGVGRLDSRAALEYIEHVIDLVREESAAFKAYNDEAVKEELKELVFILSRIETRIENAASRQKPGSPFVVVKVQPKYIGDSAFVEYWTTDGEEGNRIPAGRELKLYRGNDIVPGSCSFVTTTIGGKEKLTSEEKLHTYRYHLLSRNRIVSKRDLAALCYKVFGDNLGNVRFEKGLQAGLSSTSGYERTLDIHLTLNKKVQSDDWDYKCEQIHQTLEEDGIYVLPCRIFSSN